MPMNYNPVMVWLLYSRFHRMLSGVTMRMKTYARWLTGLPGMDGKFVLRRLILADHQKEFFLRILGKEHPELLPLYQRL
jgi:hypothetical protein